MTAELAAFYKQVDALTASGHNILSIDETGFISNQLPLRGYGDRDKRLRVVKRHPKRFKVTATPS
ncbi:hypothetical protein TSOC_004825, partial [Tetrabaena socialis]